MQRFALVCWILAANAAASLIAAEPAKRRPWTEPLQPAPEYGHGLDAKRALAGWISLFDGASAYGWRGAKVSGSNLSGGKTTTAFGPLDLRMRVTRPGTLRMGGQRVTLPVGIFRGKKTRSSVAPLELLDGLQVRSLTVRPLGLKPQFNGKDMKPWRILHHPRRPNRRAKWRIEKGIVIAVGGPGALELPRKYGDLILQIRVRTRKPLVNGGVFFRAIEGDFMNGYEAQLFNACYDRDPAQPARYSTGAIDDRQLARRLVSRDLQPFLMTVVAHGPQITTWVNGMQMVDWTDRRAPHRNPRSGKRLAPGVLQLQAHDPETDIEFHQLWVSELDPPRQSKPAVKSR